MPLPFILFTMLLPYLLPIIFIPNFILIALPGLVVFLVVMYIYGIVCFVLGKFVPYFPEVLHKCHVLVV